MRIIGAPAGTIIATIMTIHTAQHHNAVAFESGGQRRVL
jgi:hypothetical protein